MRLAMDFEFSWLQMVVVEIWQATVDWLAYEIGFALPSLHNFCLEFYEFAYDIKSFNYESNHKITNHIWIEKRFLS